MAVLKNGAVHVNGTVLEYVAFGRGRRVLVMIPGLGDGLTTVRGKAGAMALSYRLFARDFRVCMFSRGRALPPGRAVADMAEELAAAMKALGLERACVLGVSQGGMIAQHLAAEHPELVDRLVLAVTTDRTEEMTRRVLSRWEEYARRGDYAALMTDTAEKSYSEEYKKRYRLLYPLLGRVGKPRSYERFLRQAAACAAHDGTAVLDRIGCPTLVIGGEADGIVGPEGSRRLAAAIPGAQLYMYPGLGHGLYEEAKDFNHRVRDFFLDRPGP